MRAAPQLPRRVADRDPDRVGRTRCRDRPGCSHQSGRTRRRISRRSGHDRRVCGGDDRSRALRGALLLRQGTGPLGGGGDSRRGAQRRRPDARRASQRTAVELRRVVLPLGRPSPGRRSLLRTRRRARGSCGRRGCSEDGCGRGRCVRARHPCSSARSDAVRPHTRRHPRAGGAPARRPRYAAPPPGSGGVRRSGGPDRVPGRSDRRSRF